MEKTKTKTKQQQKIQVKHVSPLNKLDTLYIVNKDS